MVAGAIEGINVLGGHWANTIAPGVTAATRASAIGGGGSSHQAVAANCPFVAEEDKPLHDRGKYLNPEIYGQPKERAIGYSSALEEMAKPK